ncbi:MULTISPECIES: hypothetical protein [Nitrosomonas]|uniref:Uncharacterized protein n=1 Tax=Nitrosomonas communis TaxID=44574 RepID=A0A0F7KDF6_9PROT|nr:MULTISPECIES: hypothetical protein [Nitrosomonas]AKH37586.1 hypothetical protein AAW31_06780 [Nitrosomonas communis]TYP69646.1 hypothetical protein BCL69_11442 [Nitrosomonas communis]UVS62856.1 hypothetical protein NX761_07055 [Nitrosomonas sp. PLL12]
MDLEVGKLDALKFLTKHYIDNVWISTSVHLVTLGWLFSSEQIHMLIKEELFIQIGLTCILLVLESLRWFVNRPIYRRIKFLEMHVAEKISIELADAYTIKPYRFICNELLICLLTLFSITFIWFYPYL